MLWLHHDQTLNSVVVDQYCYIQCLICFFPPRRYSNGATS